jgi:hypothetical protein
MQFHETMIIPTRFQWLSISKAANPSSHTPCDHSHFNLKAITVAQRRCHKCTRPALTLSHAFSALHVSQLATQLQLHPKLGVRAASKCSKQRSVQPTAGMRP